MVKNAAPRISAVILALAAAACAPTRSQSYDATLGRYDARVFVGGKEFYLYFHEQDRTVMLRRGLGGQIGNGLLGVFTLNPSAMSDPAPVWRAAAQAPLTEFACTVSEAYPIDGQQQWEATFECEGERPAPAQIAERREAWRAGLNADDPMSPDYRRP